MSLQANAGGNSWQRFSVNVFSPSYSAKRDMPTMGSPCWRQFQRVIASASMRQKSSGTKVPNHAAVSHHADAKDECAASAALGFRKAAHRKVA